MTRLQKILLVGHFSDVPEIYTYATSFHKALVRLGYQVKIFDYRRQTFLLSFLLKHSCKIFDPDMIFFVKAERVSWRTIRFLKQYYSAKIVNFYPDNPFVFWNSNSNSDVLKSLPFIDYFLIWSEQLIPIIRSAGARKVFYFPFAFDKDLFSGAVKCNDEIVFKSDVCFIGTWDEARQRWLERLMERIPNLNLAIWGNRWYENLPSDSVLIKHIKGNAIYGNEMLKAFDGSKIVLNFIRNQNLNAHNMRTFEIPASKTFMLTQYTEEQAKILFKNGESVECFKNIEELVFKVKFFLKNDEIRKMRIDQGFLSVQKYVIEEQLAEFLKKVGF